MDHVLRLHRGIELEGLKGKIVVLRNAVADRRAVVTVRKSGNNQGDTQIEMEVIMMVIIIMMILVIVTMILIIMMMIIVMMMILIIMLIFPFLCKQLNLSFMKAKKK